MTVKLYCTICGKEIPEQAEGEGWDEYIIKIQRRPWGEPHMALKTPLTYQKYVNLVPVQSSPLLKTKSPKSR